MKGFQTKYYEIQSEKIKKDTELRFVVLTDLHGREYGNEHADLLKAVEDLKPDAVLVLGDMIVRSNLKSFSIASVLMKKLAEKFRVYSVLGNHEYKIMTDETQKEHYQIYEKQLVASDVCFLHNQRISTRIKDYDVAFYGLELPIEYYKKPFSPNLSIETMRELLGNCKKNEISILLAHNPKYGDTYFQWGADLTLSGHYHGGVIRLNEHVGVSSPQYLLFPPYCCGDFHKGKQHMIVGAGLGEHTIPIRIHNPRELLAVTLCAADAHTGKNGADKK